LGPANFLNLYIFFFAIDKDFACGMYCCNSKSCDKYISGIAFVANTQMSCGSTTICYGHIQTHVRVRSVNDTVYCTILNASFLQVNQIC
jgi:hypothetical protein